MYEVGLTYNNTRKLIRKPVDWFTKQTVRTKAQSLVICCPNLFYFEEDYGLK
jgi:hypothetical protein